MKTAIDYIRRIAAITGLVAFGACSILAGYEKAKNDPQDLPTPGVIPADLTPYMRQISPSEIEPKCEYGAIPILMYHDIDADSNYSHSIPTEEFRAQLDYLREQGYRTLKLEDILGYMEGTLCPTTPKVIGLTFDDGYSSVYQIVFPELQSRGYNGIAFVTPMTTEMTPSEIRIMAESGVIEIESHLMTHMTSEGKYTDEQMSDELMKSKAVLEEMTGRPVIALAWPGGFRRDGDIDINLAKEKGYVGIFEAWGEKALFNDGTDKIPRLDIDLYRTFDRFKDMLRQDRTE